ncbi:MAG: hypothetical protein E6Q37_00630 [Crocinitomicaceae bacterium]|nr:MAG: hypothetical protein E6Q37_00630 [Crocinitomicaceae bacterium]
MKYKAILASTILIATVGSCVKHEIIPAPEPQVDLSCNFKGTINGTDIELTQNVNGYFLETNKSKIVPPTGLSEAIYYSEIKSGQSLTAIKLNIGKVKWDATVSSDPTAAIFNGFMNANPTPNYTTGAVLTPTNTAGFEVSYRDANGDIWLTKEADDVPNTIEFTNIVQESDKTGDYSKFIANFNCKVYHTYITITPSNPPAVGDTTYDEQSFMITDGVFKGWYKR